MDGDMLKEASKIWAMLDEMAENDPKKYRKFINKHMEEGRKVMSPPEPHCVVQTTYKNSLEAVFINVCSWSRIPEPKSDESPISIVSSDVYTVEDSFGSSSVFSVSCSPGIIKRYGQSSKNAAEKEGFILLIFDYLRDVKQTCVADSYTVLSCLDLKGSPEELYRSLKFDPLNANSQVDDVAKTLIPEHNLDSSSLLEKVNDFIVKKEVSGEEAESYSGSSIEKLVTSKQVAKEDKKVLIEELPFTFPHSVSVQSDDKLGRVIVIDIQVEGVSSVKDCNLVISKTDLCLKIQGSEGTADVTFPEEVDDANARAQFKKKKKILTIKVPARKQ